MNEPKIGSFITSLDKVYEILEIYEENGEPVFIIELLDDPSDSLDYSGGLGFNDPKLKPSKFKVNLKSLLKLGRIVPKEDVVNVLKELYSTKY